MYNRKNYFSVVLCFVLLLCTTLVYRPVSADSQKGIYNVKDLIITQEAQDFFEMADVKLCDDDQIQMVTTEVKTEGVTKQVNSIRIIHDTNEQKDILTISAFSKADQESFEPDDIPLMFSANSLNVTRQWPLKSYVTITGKTTYSSAWYNWDSYYKPISVEVWHNYSGSAHTLSTLTVSFQTEGDLCDSSYNTISTGYVHYINRTQTFPSAGTHYSTTLPLVNNRQIRYTGQIDSGMWLYFNCHLDGKTHELTVSAMPVS